MSAGRRGGGAFYFLFFHSYSAHSLTVKHSLASANNPQQHPSSPSIPFHFRFNAYYPGGSKTVVLTTASWLGGANAFTGWALLGTGAAYGLAAAGLAGVGWAGRGRDRKAGGGGAWEM